MENLTGKVALITGASTGIGRALALQLAEKKVDVALIARSEDKLKELKNDCEKFGVKAAYYVADIGLEPDVESAIRYFQGALGTVDFVINNAGMGVFKPLEEITAAEFDTMMNTNVRGTFLITRLLLPIMKRRKRGHIVVVTSDIAKRTIPTGSIYCATKYAQDAMAGSLRKEVRAFGIKVTVVYPGLVDTPFHSTEPGLDFKKEWLTAESVALAIVNVLAMPGNTTIDELMIHPQSQEY